MRRPYLPCTLSVFLLYLGQMADSITLSRALLVQAQEEERRRIARRLHDGPAHLLANAALEIETCLRLMQTQPHLAREGLTALAQELGAGADDLRGIIAELQPPLLDELGLRASVKQYVENFARQNKLTIHLSGWDALSQRLPATMETAIFRVIQEALDNVRAHARASRVQVRVERTPEQIRVTIGDDGKGFDRSRGAPTGRRLGLLAMRDRAESLNGELQIFSEPGKGVQVVLTVPHRAPSIA
ncbi:MAG: sensor histidine kinase [Chloroflexi bacterium]|nr:sensor histidine kinase [Chloroflexota bacterium]